MLLTARSSHMANNNEKIGVIGYFEDPDTLLQATKKVRDARYQNFDAFTPYPVHGLEAAQGLQRSPIPYITFIAGLTGGCLGFLLQFWTSAVDWPLIVGGKPYNSWPAFIPITFELTILFAALASAGAMILFNGLPNIKRKGFHPSLTNNRFAIVIEAPLPIDLDDARAIERQKKYKGYSESEALEFLRNAGAKDVQAVSAEGWF
jgi:hypothetical protein